MVENKREFLVNSKKKTGKLFRVAAGIAGLSLGVLLIHTMLGGFVDIPETVTDNIETIAGYSFLSAIIPLVLAILNGHKNQKIQAEFEGGYKRNILLPVYARFFDNCEYFDNEGLTREFVEKLNIVPDNFTSYAPADRLTGTYKGTNLERVSVNIKFRKKRGDKTREMVYFVGRIYTFDFDTQGTVLQVLSQKRNIFCRSVRFPGKLAENQYKKGNEVFDKTFDVFSVQGADALNVLTPNMMDIMVQIQKSSEREVLFSFVDNKLSVCFATGLLENEFLVSYKEDEHTDRDRLSEEATKDAETIVRLIEFLKLK